MARDMQLARRIRRDLVTDDAMESYAQAIARRNLERERERGDAKKNWKWKENGKWQKMPERRKRPGCRLAKRLQKRQNERPLQLEPDTWLDNWRRNLEDKESVGVKFLQLEAVPKAGIMTIVQV